MNDARSRFLLILTVLLAALSVAAFFWFDTAPSPVQVDQPAQGPAPAEPAEAPLPAPANVPERAPAGRLARPRADRADLRTGTRRTGPVRSLASATACRRAAGIAACSTHPAGNSPAVAVQSDGSADSAQGASGPLHAH